MWRAAHPQTSTHPAHPQDLAIHTNSRIHDRLAGESCTHHSSLITRHCLIQSLAKHNRKPTQLTENNRQRSKSIASFCRVFRNSRAFSDDATSIVILRTAPLRPAGRRISPPHSGGRGTQRRICFYRNSTRCQILIASPIIKNGRK